MKQKDAVFSTVNRVALHESGHAIVGWLMKKHCDPGAFESIFQIFHYLDEEDGTTRGVCHFSSNRATNFDPSPIRTRNVYEATTDLAINIAGCATYRAYLDPAGDPAYHLSTMSYYHSDVNGNNVNGLNHDFRYFSDISRFDLGLSIDSVEGFATTFQESIIQLLLEEPVMNGIGAVAKGLLSLANRKAQSLNLAELKTLEELIEPTFEHDSLTKQTNNLLELVRTHYS